ncbi:glycosyltransferase family 4 protein [Hyphobacterium sp. CCMP332]|uniref:glycosyltransferase family 4 protein n=1 Tax=Hyphobacterium sp. CCMP332 TaxID=2749086 RepID=UPI00164F5C3A|nr:glycosyltransferase family 4 protein [Hyphobacterium sp. CCMP332]QNL17875.1 glycosyltransferase family 4 protein [Hyphobacterium sp. CCMP332]
MSDLSNSEKTYACLIAVHAVKIWDVLLDKILQDIREQVPGNVIWLGVNVPDDILRRAEQMQINLVSVSASYGNLSQILNALSTELEDHPVDGLFNVMGGERACGWVLQRLARKLKVPFVLRVSGNDFAVRRLRRDANTDNWKSRLFWWYNRQRMLSAADGIWVMSDAEAERIKFTLPFKSNIFVGPRGIHIPEQSWAPTGNARPRVITIGRMSAEKSPDLIFKLARQHPGWDFVWIGDHQISHPLPDYKNFRWTKYLDGAAIESELRQSDVFLLPSKSDAMPQALLEALAVGVPSIVSRQIEMPKIEKYRPFIQVSYSADRYSEVLQNLLGDKDKQLALSHAAKRYVDEVMSQERLASSVRKRLHDIYQY